MKTHSRKVSTPLLLNAVGLLLALFAVAHDASADETLRPGDRIWEVSTRHLSACPSVDAPLQVSSFVENCFQPSSLETLLTDPVALNAPRTIIYVHGNWMEWDNARDRGLIMYRALASRSCEPINLILFSWPSQRTQRRIRDVLEKADLADAHAYYFADFIQHLPASQPLSVMSFSFGGALTCGALHLVSGGTLQGRSLPTNPVHANIRLSLTAPAFGKSELGTCGKYSHALTQVERLVNLYNSNDPVLQRFRFVDNRKSPAAGFSGIDYGMNERLQGHPRIVQYDCKKGTGRSHYEVEYICNCTYFQHSIDNALGR